MSDLALVAEERIEQILDAAVICIAKLGLDGATLDQIAAQAGIARGHLRHFVGNQDELVGRVGEHLLDRYVVALSEAAGEAPDRSAGASRGQRPVRAGLEACGGQPRSRAWARQRRPLSADATRCRAHERWNGQPSCDVDQPISTPTRRESGRLVLLG